MITTPKLSYCIVVVLAPKGKERKKRIKLMKTNVDLLFLIYHHHQGILCAILDQNQFRFPSEFQL